MRDPVVTPGRRPVTQVEMYQCLRTTIAHLQICAPSVQSRSAKFDDAHQVIHSVSQHTLMQQTATLSYAAQPAWVQANFKSARAPEASFLRDAAFLAGL